MARARFKGDAEVLEAILGPAATKAQWLVHGETASALLDRKAVTKHAGVISRLAAVQDNLSFRKKMVNEIFSKIVASATWATAFTEAHKIEWAKTMTDRLLCMLRNVQQARVKQTRWVVELLSDPPEQKPRAAKTTEHAHGEEEEEEEEDEEATHAADGGDDACTQPKQEAPQTETAPAIDFDKYSYGFDWDRRKAWRMAPGSKTKEYSEDIWVDDKMDPELAPCYAKWPDESNTPRLIAGLVHKDLMELEVRPTPQAAKKAQSKRGAKRDGSTWSNIFEGTKLCVKLRADREPLVSMQYNKKQICMARVGAFSSPEAAFEFMTNLATEICEKKTAIADVYVRRNALLSAMGIEVPTRFSKKRPGTIAATTGAKKMATPPPPACATSSGMPQAPPTRAFAPPCLPLTPPTAEDWGFEGSVFGDLPAFDF